ncbi:minor capsid protein [Tumebacillus flagellatus]|uniref:Phage protein n=1 Tax=Tumebacillus flagellatus TaxID=1157490 RepID=A0A074LNS2_9BACL|nr:minor capsid protein [Tumebacillus flagellatus]KEO81493.1 hypothetical protein EL26_20690 [Tumebacillus flagellatus]
MLTVEDLCAAVKSVSVCDVIDYFPEELDDLVMARFTGGSRDIDLPTLREPTFQVIVRNRDASKAERLATQIESQLHTSFVQISGYDCTIFSKHEPLDLGKDGKERQMYSMNFEMIYQTRPNSQRLGIS